MSRPTLLQIAVLLLVFGSGVGIGLYLGTNSSAAASAAKSHVSTWAGSASDADAPDDLKSNTLLSSRIRELEKQLDEQKQNQVSIAANRLAFFQKYKQSIRLNAFGSDAKITPEMADILGLTKQEIAEIEQQLAQTKSQMDELVDDSTVVAKQTTDGITYDIPPDPKGKELREHLTQAINDALGNDRGGLFVNYSGFDNTWNDSFSGFTMTDHQVQLHWINKNGKQLYTWRESYGNGSASWNDTPGDLPDSYQKYVPSNLPH